MTLIYLITGTHPAELSQQNGRVKFDAKISNKLMKWLEKITQPYPDLRFDSARSAQKSLYSNKIETNDNSVYLGFTEVQAKTRSKNKRSKIKHTLIKLFSTSKLIEEILDIVVGLLVVLCTLRALWAVLFEMKGIINFSLTTIAKLLSIEHFGFISELIKWSNLGSGISFFMMWLMMAFLCSIPISGLINIMEEGREDDSTLTKTIVFSVWVIMSPIIVLVISPILPLLLPVAILGTYDVMKRMLFPKPLKR
jgi:hypothetical protein